MKWRCNSLLLAVTHNSQNKEYSSVCLVGMTHAGLFAEVGPLITTGYSASFLRPDMASKNYAEHGIGLSQYWIIRSHVWHRFFDAISGVKKLPNFLPAITYLTSAFEPSHYGTVTVKLGTLPFIWRVNCQSSVIIYDMKVRWISTPHTASNNDATHDLE